VPELPDVVVYIEHLRNRLAGRTLQGVRIVNPFVLRSVTPAMASARGKEVVGVRRMGKRIVIALEGELFLVLHLMIAGRLRWLEKDAKLPGRITLAAFEFLPLVVLRGNNDPPSIGELDWSATLEGVKVHAHHGHLKPNLAQEPDVLLHGHTHRRRAERVGRTLVVNPGALYRTTRRTLALLRLPACEVEFYEVRDDGVALLPHSA